MESSLREMMLEIGSDELDKLVQSIVKIERSFKDRNASVSMRREQIQGEIQNFINIQKKDK